MGALYLFGAVPSVGDFRAYAFFGAPASGFFFGAAALLFLTPYFFGPGGFGGFFRFGFTADGFLFYLLPVLFFFFGLLKLFLIALFVFAVLSDVGGDLGFLRCLHGLVFLFGILDDLLGIHLAQGEFAHIFPELPFLLGFFKNLLILFTLLLIGTIFKRFRFATGNVDIGGLDNIFWSEIFLCRKEREGMLGRNL